MGRAAGDVLQSVPGVARRRGAGSSAAAGLHAASLVARGGLGGPTQGVDDLIGIACGESTTEAATRAPSHVGGPTGRSVDLAAAEQVVQSADTIPAISVGLYDETVFAVFSGAAVLLAQQIDQQRALFLVIQPYCEGDFVRLGVEVVDEQHRVVAPVISHQEDRGLRSPDNGEVTPTHLRDLLSHADDSFGPVQQRIRMPPLNGRVDMLEAIRSAGNDWHVRLIALREAGVWLVRPLHRRARAMTLGELQVVAHAELVAIANARRAGQC